QPASVVRAMCGDLDLALIDRPRGAAGDLDVVAPGWEGQLGSAVGVEVAVLDPALPAVEAIVGVAPGVVGGKAPPVWSGHGDPSGCGHDEPEPAHRRPVHPMP